MSPLTIMAHVIAACLASTPKVPPRVLLAVSWVESRWTLDAVSRPHGGRYPIYCGPLQTAAMGEAQCRDQASLGLGYRRGREELEQWLRDPRVRGDLRRALLGHGCGNSGLVTGTCHSGYEARVLSALHLLGGE